MQRTNILVVDDDEGICQTLQLGLSAAGYQTTAVHDGDAALRICRQQRFDLAIIDLIMPRREGLETMLELKRLCPHLATLAISGGGCGAADDYLRMAAKLGANLTLAKPFGIENLLAAIELALPAR
jgi:DNA-binding response OmpR family regulator